MSYEEFSAHPLLSGVSDDAVRAMHELGESVTLAPGEELMHAGDEPSFFYMVLEGELEVFLPMTVDRFSEVKLASVNRGACIGEYSFIDQRRLSASVRALTEARLFRMAHSDFQAFIEENRDTGFLVLRNLLGTLVKRLRAANEEFDLFTLPAADF